MVLKEVVMASLSNQARDGKMEEDGWKNCTRKINVWSDNYSENSDLCENQIFFPLKVCYSAPFILAVLCCVSSIANVDGIQFTGLHQHHIHHYHHHHHHNQRHLRSPRYSYCPPTCRDGMNHHQPILPQSSRSSFYSRGSSRPESLALDVASVDIRMQTMSLPLQPTSRVSSFRRESKTAQTLSIVVGGFVACWLPFFIMYLLTPFVDIQPMLMSFLMWLGKWFSWCSVIIRNTAICFLPYVVSQPRRPTSTLIHYFHVLGWINSAINPFIYAFYSPDFRIAFWRLTFRHCSTPKSPPDFSLRHK